MKRIIFSVFICMLCFLNSFCQNVGIGNNNPQARLDIAKPGGDTPSLNVRGSVTMSQFNLGTNEDTYIRGGKNSSHVILNDNGSGRVGIGMSTPGFPLNFSETVGDKISLYGSSGAHYGFGIQPNQMLIHSDGTLSDIVFGWGSYFGFGENMRIKGNGRVGIGTPAPANRLDVAGLNNWDLVNTEGDMRIGTPQYRLKFGVALGGGGVGAAGIMQSGGINLLSLGSNNAYQLQINGADNSVSISNNALLKFPAALTKKIIFYPGSVGDANIGVFANELRISSDYSGADITFGYDNRTSGFTEKFRMRANGALSINGSSGNAGQVLTSTGGSASEWRSPSKQIFDNTIMKVQGASLTTTTATPPTEIPNLTYTFSTSTNVKILVNTNVNAFALSCALCGSSNVWVDLNVNGSMVHRFAYLLNNGDRMGLSGSYLLQYGPGNYTINLVAHSSGPDVWLEGSGFVDTSRFILIIVPE